MDFHHINPKLVSQSFCAWILLANRKNNFERWQTERVICQRRAVPEAAQRTLRADRCRNMSLPGRCFRVRKSRKRLEEKLLLAVAFFRVCRQPTLPLQCTLSRTASSTPSAFPACTSARPRVVSSTSCIVCTPEPLRRRPPGISRYVQDRTPFLDTPGPAPKHTLLLSARLMMKGAIAYHVHTWETSAFSLAPFCHHFAQRFGCEDSWLYLRHISWTHLNHLFPGSWTCHPPPGLTDVSQLSFWTPTQLPLWPVFYAAVGTIVP